MKVLISSVLIMWYPQLYIQNVWILMYCMCSSCPTLAVIGTSHRWSCASCGFSDSTRWWKWLIWYFLVWLFPTLSPASTLLSLPTSGFCSFTKEKDRGWRIKRLGNSLDLFHALLYDIRFHSHLHRSWLMTGQVDRLKESGRGRSGCKDMGAGMMKGAGLL